MRKEEKERYESAQQSGKVELTLQKQQCQRETIKKEREEAERRRLEQQVQVSLPIVLVQKSHANARHLSISTILQDYQ